MVPTVPLDGLFWDCIIRESHASKVSAIPWDSGTAEYIWKLFDNSGAEGKN